MSRSPDGIDAFVGTRIALRRAALGLSQTALAQRLGISFQQVQKYESGANRVSASRLHHIAGILGGPIASFFPERSETERAGAGDDIASLSSLRFLTASTDGRAVAAAFPLIEDREVRHALARLVGALTGAR